MRSARGVWLLPAVPCALLLAILNPHLAGRLQWGEWARGGGVFLVFLASGSRLERSALLAAWRNRRAVFFVQGCGFVAVPALVKLMTLACRAFGANDAVLKGVMSIACMPPALTSGVVLARVARADEAAAVVGAALGSALAVLLTPLLLLCMCGATTLESLSRPPLQPLVTVLLPLALGQLLAKPLCGLARRSGWTVEVILVLLLYGGCCDALIENEGELEADHVLLAVSLVMAMVCGGAALCRLVGNALLPAADADAAILCATQKSLTFAAPRLHMLFSGGALLSLPLLIQQPAQLLLGAAFAAHLRLQRRRRHSSCCSLAERYSRCRC